MYSMKSMNFEFSLITSYYSLTTYSLPPLLVHTWYMHESQDDTWDRRWQVEGDILRLILDGCSSYIRGIARLMRHSLDEPRVYLRVILRSSTMISLYHRVSSFLFGISHWSVSILLGRSLRERSSERFMVAGPQSVWLCRASPERIHHPSQEYAGWSLPYHRLIETLRSARSYEWYSRLQSHTMRVSSYLAVDLRS